MTKEELILCKKKIEELKEKGFISNSHDLYGNDNPSLLFPLILKAYENLLDPNLDIGFSKEEIEDKKRFNKLVRKIGPLFLQSKQIMEDKSELLGKESTNESLPEGPIIFASNHGFHDDILGTVLAAKTPTYVMFASLPQFYNTIDGVLLYKNGVVLMNRKVKESKKSVIRKSLKVLENGSNLIIYPEGVWNKSPNLLTLPLWSGVYKIAKEANAKIVPIIHYIKDPTLSIPKKDNPFHTVIDSAIDVSTLDEEETLQLLSDSFNTYTYLMMEKYGKTTRDELLDGYFDSVDAWENELRKRVDTATKYDIEIETTADFKPKGITRPNEVYESIARRDLTARDAKDIIDAKKLVKEYQRNDFQHRF